MKFLIFVMLSTCSLAAVAQKEQLMKQLKEMRDEKDPGKSLAMMKKIKADNKLEEQKDADVIDMMWGDVAMDYVVQGKYQDFDRMIAKMSNKFNQTSYLNMAAATLVGDKKDPAKAEQLAKKTLDLYISFKDDPKARPANYSDEDWKRFMDFAYYPYCDTYAMALHAVGKNKQALEFQEKSFNGSPEEGMAPSVERYAELLVLNDQEDNAYDLLLNMAERGKSTEGMNKLLKKMYVKKNGEAGFDSFFAKLQENVIITLKEDLKKKMKDDEAPGFELEDLEGNSVSLASLRGKTVILDFWATWCAPCKASFPAMKKMQQKHPEVKFLFIATQEKPEGASERVKKYITDNEYPFHVLMDELASGSTQKFEALSAYNVEGIPTKVIIDGKGIKRFVSVGYTSDTELMNELEAMIQLVSGQG